MIISRDAQLHLDATSLLSLTINKRKSASQPNTPEPVLLMKTV